MSTPLDRTRRRTERRDWAEWDAEHEHPESADEHGSTKAEAPSSPRAAATDEGGPKSDHWGNWTRVDPEAVRQAKIDDLTQRVYDQNKVLAQMKPERLDDFIQKQVDMIKPTTDWKLANGTIVSITNGIRSTPEQQKQLMDEVEKLTTKYPPTGDKPPLTVNILNSAAATKLMGAKAQGATIEGGTQVWISPKVFGPDADYHINKDATSGWHPPATYGVGAIRSVVTHEFGHTLDQPGHSEAVRAVMTPKSRDEYMPSPSRYGQTNSAERYAEAFSEWELSGGTTPQPLPQALAGPAGWK